MPHKTIHHVLTHQAAETSLAGCLAARDNKLPVKGERGPCLSVSLQNVCVAVCVTGSMCECEMWAERRDSWGCAALSDFSHFFLIWRCCFPVLRGGNSYACLWLCSFGCSGTFWTVAEKSLYSEDRWFSALNNAQLPFDVTGKKNWVWS